jgi:hypothetical protein
MNLRRILMDYQNLYDSFKRLDKTFKRATNHIKYKFLSNTNNNLENFFGVTLLKLLKRKHRTIKGLKRRLKLFNIRWIHRNVLHQ